MAESITQPIWQRISEAMDGRTNRWLIQKLEDKGIKLTTSQVSQRLSGLIEFRGEEAIACFEILNIPIISETVSS